MAADKLNPTPSDLVDQSDELRDALSQPTLASKDNLPQSPLTSPPPPPPTAATTATFHPPTHVDATPLGATAGLGEAELSEGMKTSTRETRGMDALAAGDENNEERKSLLDAVWEAMAAEGIDIMGGNNIAGLVGFPEQNPEWLENHSKGKESNLRVLIVAFVDVTHLLDCFQDLSLDRVSGSSESRSDAVPGTIEEFLAFLGDRDFDEQYWHMLWITRSYIW